MGKITSQPYNDTVTFKGNHTFSSYTTFGRKENGLRTIQIELYNQLLESGEKLGEYFREKGLFPFYSELADKYDFDITHIQIESFKSNTDNGTINYIMKGICDKPSTHTLIIE